METYSAFNLVKHALSGHRHWPKAWRSPELKPAYDVVVIGGGGHGLATAYYLAKSQGITNVAVLEKGWIGGGNMAAIPRLAAQTISTLRVRASTSTLSTLRAWDATSITISCSAR